MISYSKLCKKYNRILYTTILFTLYSAPPLPSARSAHARLCPAPSRPQQAPHRACALPRAPRLQNRAWTFYLCSHGQSFFIRTLMDLPDIVVVGFLFEAFRRPYFAAGLSILPRYRFIAVRICRARSLQKPPAAVRTAFRDKTLLQSLHQLYVDEIQQSVEVHLLDDLALALNFSAHTVLGLHLRCVYLGMLLPSRTSSLSTRKTPQCSTPAY